MRFGDKIVLIENGGLRKFIMATRLQESTLHILLLGDFSGRANRGLNEPGSNLASRRPLQVDRDNGGNVLDGMGVQLTRIVAADDREQVSIRFSTLDDFHPDRLYETVNLFSSLRSLRLRLLDESTFSDAAAEVFCWGKSAGSEIHSEAVPEKTTSEAGEQVPDQSQLLDQVLKNTPSYLSTTGEIDWNRMINRIIAPLMPRHIDPRRDELVACVDSASQALMTALLHHPHFQELEATWRGIDMLVRRIETDVHLKIFLVDVSKAELAADLASDLRQESGLYRLLDKHVRESGSDEPRLLLCGLYRFGESVEDVQLLAQLACIADAANCPFLSSSDDTLVGCRDVVTLSDSDQWEPMNTRVQMLWDELCGSAEAARIALFWPRFLLRMPYGSTTNPIDSFAFEEMPDGIQYGHFLWGNSVILAACVIGQKFAEVGLNFRTAQGGELTDLPIVTGQENGETRLDLCTEMLLDERSTEHLRRRGITPILSIPGRDAIRIPTLQSIRGDVLEVD